MGNVVTVGLDLAKNVFQVRGVDVEGSVLFRRKLRRTDVLRFFASLAPCLVQMEACASSHHWAREIGELGHEVRLMPPACVKPYVKRGKTDASDAEARQSPIRPLSWSGGFLTGTGSTRRANGWQPFPASDR